MKRRCSYFVITVLAIAGIQFGLPPSLITNAVSAMVITLDGEI